MSTENNPDCFTDGDRRAGRATTPEGAARSACRELPALSISLCALRLHCRELQQCYLYAIAALDGPARWMTSKRLKPTSRHHFSKSASE
jgi:hypothetical protein